MSNLNLINIAWDEIRWPLVRERVRRLQRRIFKAKKLGQTSKVHWLQKLLIHSFDAKVMAVHQVTTLNCGKATAGVDGKATTNSIQKMALAKKLRLNGKASSIRRVWIPKPGKGEKRPLGIPTIQDRAKQALAKLALEPEWEAVFEPNSYGFRPARGCHDAIESIFLSLRHGTPKWVYDADIRKCFDRINHKALLTKLNTFSEMEEQIKAWLKADIMEGYANNPKGITGSVRLSNRARETCSLARENRCIQSRRDLLHPEI
jgi:RNA-directed DNA polymerase